jgi:hypothetical protein
MVIESNTTEQTREVKTIRWRGEAGIGDLIGILTNFVAGHCEKMPDF